ncbi:MAG: rRNA maturation RNase YbeY [Flavobacteriales bacterium]|jgi:probable rRNA maturation factor|tara:strand:- start:903 stop:1325 length:423 start_codon:yes stop_codon:yes gene_type:complete
MPIEYVYNTDFSLSDEFLFSSWLNRVVLSENFNLGLVVYAFFNDKELKDLNIKHLGHDFYTDILSFDETTGKNVQGSIAISVDRVKENAKTYNVSFENELLRVMAHGVLHFMGYNDINKEQKIEMTNKENLKIKMFHMEQ